MICGDMETQGEGVDHQDFMFPSEQPAWSLPPMHHYTDPAHFPSSNNHATFYPDVYSRRASTALQFPYDTAGPSTDPLGLYASPPFSGLRAEFGRMTAQEIMDAKALAASKSHSEAERRRRERINAHMAKLRSLLPSTTKTDKASLLAEVIQHVKELKRQTSEINDDSLLPTESDELTVDSTIGDEEGRFLVRASLCCDDRSDLLPDLIRALKSLRLRTLKAEITTLGGRVKNVLLFTGEDGNSGAPHQSIDTIQDALKAVMDRQSVSDSTSTGSAKRQRTSNVGVKLERRSINY